MMTDEPVSIHVESEHIYNICVFVGFISAVWQSSCGLMPYFLAYDLCCVRICRLMPSSPRKTSSSRSASSWTPARELGLALPPGGQNHHLQLHCRLTHIYTPQLVAHTHTHACDNSFCKARPLGKLAPVHFTSSSFTVNTSPINQLCLSLGIEPVCLS